MYRGLRALQKFFLRTDEGLEFDNFSRCWITRVKLVIEGKHFYPHTSYLVNRDVKQEVVYTSKTDY